MSERLGLPSLAMVAGEASGDLLASHVLRSLKASGRAYQAVGIGGPHMAEQGFTAWWPSEKLSVRGYVEVLRHLPSILRIRRALKARLIADKPKVFMGIDAPDFNLGLEAELKAAGIPTVHFVSPSIWAWRRERLQKIKHSVAHMLCVFPFEPQLYEGSGVKATFVGHPLADVIPMQPDRSAARATLGLQQEGLIVALLPGSRVAEIRYLLPVFLQSAHVMSASNRLLQYVLPIAHEGLRAQIKEMLAKYPKLPVKVIQGNSHLVLEACDATMVASGTATLEAALYKRPMVVAYRMPVLSWWLLKGKNYLPHISLPNILCNEALVPELVQHACTPEALAKAMLTELADEKKRAHITERFTAMHVSLKQDCAMQVSKVLQAYL
jgi:lipid-A-disaccharide synthase